MADKDYFSDMTLVKRYLANDIVTSAKNIGGLNHEYLKADYIAGNTIEVNYRSLLTGPDIITLTVLDPAWDLQCSGICNRTNEGIFAPIDINFPSGTDVWWRLNMVIGSGGDTVQLQFQHRMVSYLQADFGPLKIKPKSTTRAQFIKQLADRIPGSLPPAARGPGGARAQAIQVVIPELNVVQPLAGKITTKASTTHKAAKVNRTGTVWRVTASLESLGGTGSCRAIQADGYSELSTDPTLPVSQLDFAALGNLPCLAKMKISNPANGKSVVVVKQDKGAGSTFNGPPSGYPVMGLYPGTAQALGLGLGGHYTVDIELADGSGSLSPVRGSQTSALGGTAGSSSSSVTKSDISSLARGNSTNPDEDSWTCMQRLAQEVNWECFTTAHPTEGEWGNYLYYITGPKNDAQPADAKLIRSSEVPGTWDLHETGAKETKTVTNCLNQRPSYTVDDTAFQGKSTKTKHLKVIRKVNRYKPQTPTSINIQLVCEPMQYTAGGVLIFENSGPLDGRWIIAETDRNIVADPYEDIYLNPPTAPSKEPTITVSVPGSGSSTIGSLKNQTPGTAAAAYAAAQYLSDKKVHYQYGGDRDATKPPNVAAGMDCSGSVGWVLHNAGFPMPSGFSPTAVPASGAYTSWGLPGRGKEMTIWTCSSHIFIEFSLQGQPKMQGNTVNPGDQGFRLISWSYSNADAGDGASGTFTPRHPVGV